MPPRTRRGHGADIERLGVGAVHGVAGAQQAAVQILDVLAHEGTLPAQDRGEGDGVDVSAADHDHAVVVPLRLRRRT